MKTLLFLAFTSLTLIANAQKPVVFAEVIKLDSSITKEELFKRARMWFAESFKSSKDVLQISDKESGELVGKPMFTYYSQYFTGSGATKGKVSYTVKVFVKQGRYKYEIGDFMHEAYRSNEYPKDIGLIMVDTFKSLGFIGGKNLDKKVWNELKSLSEKEATTLIISLKEFMLKPSESNEEDW